MKQSEEHEELTQLAIQEYNAYYLSHREPLSSSNISLEKTDTRVEIFMDTTYRGISYSFISMRPEHAVLMQECIDKQPLVREKFADGITRTIKQTQDRNKVLVDRFELSDDGQPKEPDTHLFSGFIVCDAETNVFLGYCVLGASSLPNSAEMARLNRKETWSMSIYNPEEVLPIREVQEIVQEYTGISEDDARKMLAKIPIDKTYNGLGFSETATLIQYGKHIADKGYTLKCKELQSIDSTARVDNPGSWKSNAKAGFEAYDVTNETVHGNSLRFKLKRPLF